MTLNAFAESTLHAAMGRVANAIDGLSNDPRHHLARLDLLRAFGELSAVLQIFEIEDDLACAPTEPAASLRVVK